MGAEEALHRRRQLHAPSGEADEDGIVVFEILDSRLQRRQVADFVLPLHLLDRRAIVLGIGCHQFKGHQMATDLRLDDFRDRLGVLGAREIDDQDAPISCRLRGCKLRPCRCGRAPDMAEDRGYEDGEDQKELHHRGLGLLLRRCLDA
jgi:hypothetical protein